MALRYGKRTGWTKLVLLLKALVRLYSVFSSTIDSWAEGHMDSADYVRFKEFTALIPIIATILDAIPDD